MEIVTAAWADEFFAKRLYSQKWIEAPEETRQSALAMSTSLIEAYFTFPSGTFTLNEETNLYDCDERIKKAICEEAIWCLKFDPTDYPEILTKGFVEADTAQYTSVKLDKDYTVPVICKAAIAYIGDLGELNDGIGRYKPRLITG